MAERQDDPSSWDGQWEIFHAAVELPVSERSEFLARVCPDDALRREVEELLASHEEVAGQLDRPLESSTVDQGRNVSSEPTQFRKELAPTLAPGTILANRFEIIRMLGRGGMGSVYEAEDRVLDTRVALKMLRPEISHSTSARQRFLREVQLARQVTHPNVCRIYDLFHQGDGQSFLSMELLAGETLAKRLERDGALEITEAEAIVQQVGAALGAAHGVGVIHRDLKSANVMLVPDGEETRAVVTDFGLATTARPDDPSLLHLTRTGQILGTPAFMAPEQLEGDEITPATDIYALGLVIFEMLTGKLPFDGLTPYSIAARRLHEDAPSPRQHLPDLDRRWERIILRCLERKPGDRFASIEEMRQALESDTIALPPSRRLRRVRGIGWAAAAILLVLAAMLAWPRVSRLIQLPQSVSTSDEESGVSLAQGSVWVLISDFDDRTEEDLLAGTLKATLERDLADSSLVNVVSAGRVEDVLLLMRRPLDTLVDEALAQEVALRDGDIRAVVAGKVELLGSTYLLSVELLNPVDGVALASLSEEAASQKAILPAVSRLSSRLRESLGDVLPTLVPGKANLSKVSTPSLRALRLYSQADQLLFELMPETAERLLREAIAEDPEFASSYTHLAWALRSQDRPWEEYLPYAERALELADRATVVERQFIRGSYYQMLSLSTQSDADGEAALAQYRALLEIEPGHFWAADNAAGALRELGRGRESLDLLLRLLDARPNDVGIVSRVALAFVTVEGDLEKAKSYVNRAEELQRALPIRDSRWQPFLDFFPVHELWVLGDTESVVREIDRIVDSLGDRTAGEREDLAWRALENYLDLGMFRKAEEVQESFGTYPPYTWEQKLGGRRNDQDVEAERIRRILSRRDDSSLSSRSRGAFALAQEGLVTEAEDFLSEIPEDIGLFAKRFVLAAQGTVDVARRRFETAIPKLEEAFELFRYHHALGQYFAVANTLSQAWREAGQPERALEVLEEASRQRPRLMEAHRNFWMQVQLRLAELYRELGRDEEALEIEDELRRYCLYADSDFPILQELERLASTD